MFALALATGEDDGDLLTTVEETIEEVDKLLMYRISWLMHLTIAERVNLPIILIQAEAHATDMVSGIGFAQKVAWDGGDIGASTKLLGMVTSTFIILMLR